MAVLSGDSGGNIFGNIQKFFGGSWTTIFNTVLIVVTISGEKAFNALSFSCPCAYPQNVYYGGCFLFVPAFCLFLVGILLDSKTWRITHGWFYRHKSTSHGCRRSCYYWMNIFSQSLVAPIAWLFIGFLGGEYYSCFQASKAKACWIAQNKTQKEEIKQQLVNELGTDVATQISGDLEVDPNCVCNLPELEKKRLQATSQIIALGILLVAVLFALIGGFASSCFDRFTFRQNYYVNLYRKVEEARFEEIAKERVTEIANHNWTTFFDKTDRTNLDWDKISMVSLGNLSYFLSYKQLGRMGDPYLSPLDKWKNATAPDFRHTKSAAVKRTEGDGSVVSEVQDGQS